MIRKLTFILIISLVYLSSAFSQNVYDLKGKCIIIPQKKEYNTSEKPYTTGVYTEQVLGKFKFKEEFIYQTNILGERIEVLDVLNINKGKKKEAILIHAKHNGNGIVLYFPKQYKESDSELFTARFYTTTERSIWSEKTTACLDSIFVYHYDAVQLDSINSKYLNKNIYYVGKQQYLVKATNSFNRQKIKHQTPYIFRGISFEKDERYCNCGGWECKGYIKIPCILLGLGDKEYHLPIMMDSTHFRNTINYESNDITFKDFTEYFEIEEEFINNSKKQYNIQIIRHLKKRYEGKEIYLKANNYYIDKGYYLFKEIKPSWSNDDGIYYKYFAFLENPFNNRIYKYPITNDLDNDIVFAEEQRKIEEEEARKQAEEEAKYQAMLEKEEQEYKASLIKKFGRKNALLILDNIVQIGFTKQMCIESWGQPYDINRTITSGGTHEQWVYGIGRYLYFEGNILTAIQD